MKDEEKTKEQLINELKKLREKNSDLEKLKLEFKKYHSELKETVHKHTSALISINKKLQQENTARKEAEKELIEIKERLELAVTGTGAGLWDWYIKSNKTVFSERWAEIVGYTLEELEPVSIDTWMKLCHPGDLEKSAKLLNEHFAGKSKQYICEARMKHKNGRWIWVLDQGKVCEWDEDGKPLRMSGTHIDITRRKKIENALRESEKRYHTIFAQSPIAIELFDSNGSMIHANQASLKMFGVENIQSVEKYSLFNDPNIKNRYKEKLHQGEIVRFEESFDFEKVRKLNLYPTTRRGIIWLDVLITPLKNDEEFAGFLVQIQDITSSREAEIERERLQKQLLQSRKMEAIGTMYAGVAHNFNNILGIIMLTANAVIDNMSKNDENLDYMDLIIKSAKRAADIVEKILVFSRKNMIKEESVKIEPILKDTIELLKNISPGNIEIKENIADVSDFIPVSEHEIKQIILNLYNNSVHAIRNKKGVIEISLSKINLTREDIRIYKELIPGPYIKLIVNDTGSGIEKKFFNRIFDPFFTTKNMSENTGLGLSVVYGIVKRYKGEIKVKSTVEKGTVFEVLFPVVKKI